MASDRMGLLDVSNAAPVAVTALLAALIGTLIGRRLVDLGLQQLDVATAGQRRVRLASYATGALAGTVAVLAARHADSWWLLMAAGVWAYSLAAVAVCDAFTQRVPTALVRQATVAAGFLIVVASAVTGHWRWTVLAAAAAVVSGLIFTVCWRFLGAGFGDVRIAILGGIGQTHPTHLGVGLAVGAFIVITLGQAAGTLARGGDRRTHFPYGPAIAAAFFIAAVA